jgi:UDP-glucose 4-epimerase
MRYVVTGGAGFIGSHIAQRLLADGHTVVVVDNLLTGQRSNLDVLTPFGERFIFYEASITDLPIVRSACEGADVVFHQAALPSVPRSIADPLETHLHCATGTLTVLHAAHQAGVRRVVYAASSSAYGDQAGEYKREDMLPRPISPYGVAKLAGELYAQMFSHTYGLETVALRYFNVFGPRQDPNSPYAAVIPLFMRAMLRGQSPLIHGDGSQSRDFTYIDNVVHGNLLAAQSTDANGHVMNLATGGRVSLLELVEQINALLGTHIPPTFGPPRHGDILHSRAAIDKARDLLDFAPVVPFSEGLARTLSYYRAEWGM